MPTYRTLVVPLDGSVLAERALPFAEHLATRDRATLVLARVAIAHRDPQRDPQTGEVRVVDLAQTYLEETAERVRRRCPEVAVETAELFGEFGPAIVAEARARQADLIALSTHGRSGFGRWLYGSVAEEVLRRAPVPLLVVTPAAHEVWQESPPQQVLVALDGSAFAEAALAPAAQLAEALGASLRLVQVIEPPQPGPYGLYYGVYGAAERAIHEAAGDYLERVARTPSLAGRTVTWDVVSGFAATEIAALARQAGIGAIALATHGRTGLARLVLGSVATETLRQATRPLLLVRPAGLVRSVAHSDSAPSPA